MTTFEWFLLFWIGMAFIKWLIVIRTYFETVIKYEQLSVALTVVAIGGVFVYIGFILFWPIMLFQDRFNYFTYPDKKSLKYLADYYKHRINKK